MSNGLKKVIKDTILQSVISIKKYSDLMIDANNNGVDLSKQIDEMLDSAFTGKNETIMKKMMPQLQADICQQLDQMLEMKAKFEAMGGVVGENVERYGRFSQVQAPPEETKVEDMLTAMFTKNRQQANFILDGISGTRTRQRKPYVERKT